MLTDQATRLNDLLRYIAESLDISPTDYKRAVDSYEAVGKCLEGGYDDNAYSGSYAAPKIYPQGSIRLGTVVKPLRECAGAAYDVDLVCELQYQNIEWSSQNAETLKQMVGNRLKSDGTYCEMLDGEGKRCWTVEYAEKNGIGFHIDVLPCVPDPVMGAGISRSNPGNPDTRPDFTKTTIRLTGKDKDRNPQYEWRSGNPCGYAAWFRERNITFGKVAFVQKRTIFENTRIGASQLPLYESVEAVPDALVRTPLQRTVQILKRHRDIRFSKPRRDDPLGDPKFKPISMIITTLVARLYKGEDDLLSALMNTVNSLSHYAALIENRYAVLDESVAQRELIRRNADGRWEIQNPVNPEENFADRWHEDNQARAKAFFKWVTCVRQDIVEALRTDSIDALKEVLGDQFGGRVLNEAWNSYENANRTQSSGLILGHSRTLTRFHPPHRQAPLWPVRQSHSVSVVGQVKSNGNWRDFGSDSRPLPKHLDLLFRANTNVPRPFDVFWQIVNTGSEAERAHGLRGEIIRSKTAGVGGLTQKEGTLYTGTHWVECFIVKNGVCVARSGEYVVTIQ